MYVHRVISTYAGGRVERICAGALDFPSESDEQKAKHFDEGMKRYIAMGGGW